jgi:thioredoxin 1
MTTPTFTLTDASFDAEINSTSQAVLVDFWADWCSPCKMLAPLLDDVAFVYEGRLRIGKLNTEENKATTERFGIRSLPTMVLFVDGVERARLTGLVSKTRLAGFIDQHTAN